MYTMINQKRSFRGLGAVIEILPTYLPLSTPIDIINAAQNPGILYTGAIASLNSNITSGMSPPVQQIVSQLLTIVEKSVGSNANSVSSAILDAAIETLGADVVDDAVSIIGEVASLASSIVPIVGMLISGIMSFLQWEAAEKSKLQASLDAGVNYYLMGRQVTPSGYTGGSPAVVPSDIFAIDQSTIPLCGSDQNWGPYTSYPFQPNSTLGLILAAITEDSNSDICPVGCPCPAFNGYVPTASGPVWSYDPAAGYANVHVDDNLHHSNEFFGKMSIDVFKKPGLNQPVRRKTYQLLRRAIGSRNQDQGKSLYPVYMDMLAEDFANGNMSILIAQYMLTTYIDFRTGTLLNVTGNTAGKIAFTVAQVTPYLNQIKSMVDSWINSRDQYIAQQAAMANAAAPAVMALVAALAKQKAVTKLTLADINKTGILKPVAIAQKPSVAIVAPKKISPAVAVAGGGALAAALALLFFL